MGMTAPDLLIDIGNSRVKWALTPPHHAGALAEDEAAAHQGDPAGIVALLPECRPARIAVSQVLGAEVGARLGLALQSRYGIAPVLARVRPDHCGLRIAYADPARLGVDRWLAMLAARRLSLAQPVIIAMAGTALTLDVVDAHGRHLGGFIAPGLHTARRAMLASTRFDHQPGQEDPAGLGATTEACVASGARLACLGALDRGAALAPANAQKWIGGGDAATLAPDLPNWRVVPNPVLSGLMAMLEATD